MVYDTVGERLKKLRQAKNLTQEELGNMMGLTKAAIQKYENGQIRNFKADTIIKLTNIFQRPPAYFIFDEVPTYRLEKISEILKTHYGEWIQEFLESVEALNENGKKKLREYCADLNEIQKYKRGQKEEP